MSKIMVMQILNTGSITGINPSMLERIPILPLLKKLHLCAFLHHEASQIPSDSLAQISALVLGGSQRRESSTSHLNAGSATPNEVVSEGQVVAFFQ
jgi:hypothetical protein